VPRRPFSGVKGAGAIARQCLGQDPPRAHSVSGFRSRRLEARVKTPKGGTYGIRIARRNLSGTMAKR
jgi:hypothetical protein